MPVVTLYHDRLQSLIGKKKKISEIIEMLPYIALDIEEQSEKYIRVEYNPNRPDFSTDYGIARALKGILGIESGISKYHATKSNFSVKVHPSVKKVRPFIISMLALDGKLDDESIRQIIAMQEDIHDGIGRRRKKVSIGIHNSDVIESPLTYTAEKADFEFVPLNADKSMSIREILQNTEVGHSYGWILEGHDKYPIIKDANGNVLSFPPIINSELTRVTEKTRNLFIDITATDLKAAEDALAVVAITLYDAKFKIQTVKVDYGNKKIETPNMKEEVRKVRYDYINSLIGLDLNKDQIVKCLGRSRLSATKSGNFIKCWIPRYRIDIMHDVDLVEDVAIGYGINKMKATYPPSFSAGAKHPLHKILDSCREVLFGLGMIEVMNFSLVSMAVQYDMVNRNISDVLRVEQTKSIEHEVLRDSLLPSLLLTLSRNIHEPYPQKIFEVGKVFAREDSQVKEAWSIAGALAHKDANYTEARSYPQAFLKSAFNADIETRSTTHYMLADGRAAEIIYEGNNVGTIGEVNDQVIQNFKIRMPISVFEIDLSQILKT